MRSGRGEKALSSSGLDVNARDRQGNTALLLAAMERFAHLVTVHRSAGFRKFGWKLIDERLENIVEALRRHPGADLEVKDHTGVPVLFYLDKVPIHPLRRNAEGRLEVFTYPFRIDKSKLPQPIVELSQAMMMRPRSSHSGIYEDVD
jgi:hypothetical protein